MGKKIGQEVYKHIEEHLSLYLFNVVLLVMGIIFGTLTIHSLGYAQQHDLYTYFQQFLNALSKESLIRPEEAFIHHLIQDVKFVGIIWLLGLSIIGLPIILVMIFIKGVFVGFTVGFLVHQMGMKGFWLSFFSVIPQNMVMVPVILMISVASITFSIKLATHLFSKTRTNQKLSLAKYVGLFTVAVFTLLIVAFFQTYLSPALMKSIL
jgi:stage II sporulation protein M